MQDPTWQGAPDYPQNPRGARPPQVPRYPPTVEQRQNGTAYDSSNNGFMFHHPIQLSPDSIGQHPNGFPQNQPQYTGRTFPGQTSLSMNAGPAPSFNGTYQPPRSQSQGVGFDAHRFTQDLRQGYYSNPTFSPPKNSLSPPFLSTSPQPMLPPDPTASGQQQLNGTSYLAQRSMSSEASPSQKRFREAEITDDGKDDDGDAEKSKPHGACARCKGLKVKCEFRTDTDPCRRCLNAGAICQVPGRKKRRTPPKREHLLNQIRDQATQIENLMAQLEKAHHVSGASPLPYPSSTEQESHSPVMSPSSVHTPASSYFGHLPTTLTAADTTSSNHNRDIVEWMSKARESLAEFGGIISGIETQKLVADHEDSSDDGFFTGEEEPSGEIAFAVEDADAEVEGGQMLQGSLRRMSSTGSRRSQEPTSKNAEVPTVQSAIGLFANMAIRAQSSDDGATNVGVTSTTYFKPREGPGPEGMSARDLNAAQVHAPQILKRGIVTTTQAEELFGIYFNYMNLSLSLLDPILYTPQTTFWRSPFLFTAICAIASRYYKNKELYPQAMHYAQVAAAEGVISGIKNVEMASAYILLSLYPIPARRWEDDRSWLYLGLAIRVATDLNLQKPPAKPVNEAHAREMLNRTRVWLNCFNLDRSTGSQHGKTPTIRDSDYMACHSEDWWRQSPYNITNFDIHLCGYTAELRLMSQFVGKIHSNPEHPKGFNKDIDWERLASETDDEVSKLGEKWFAITGLSEDPQSQFRTALLKLAYSYARLAILSYAFQQDVTKNKFTEENFPILMRCLRAATDVVNSYLQNVAKPSQLVFIRHGPEAQSVFITFASAFLVKLLHPKFVKHVSGEQRLKIRALVEKVVAVLGSPEVAIDDRHAPKLYSRFLQGLLDTPMATADISSPTSFQAALPRTRSRRSRGSKPAESDNVVGSSAHNTNMSPSSANFTLANGTQSFDQMQLRSVHAGTNHSTPEMPPLAFDNDILNSMQQFTEPTLWADYTALPGLGWMSQLQDTQMSDSFLFDNSYAPNPFSANFQ